ncbi:MAG: hypothetical protein ACYS7Y_36705 [Planctomycetota bacterium]|jgi:hypothetical protein
MVIESVWPLSGFIPELSPEKWGLLVLCLLLFRGLLAVNREINKQMQDMDDDSGE